ncbi:MAG: sigma-70 family RNA polymerase sigma factor [Acidimicrobiia bacterium]
MRDTSLQEIVEAARSGDHTAWSELVVRFQDLAVAVAVGSSGDWDAAPDIAQDAFGIAFRKLVDLEEPDAFPGWFAAIVRTACSRRARVKQLARASLEGLELVDFEQRDPAAVVVAADEQARVRVAVEALPETERAVVALHYLGDLTYPEIAAFLDISVAAAKKRAFTARRRLEELLPMASDALAAARPSRTGRFRDTILMFMAIRDGDRATVADLIDRDPALAHATEDWSIDEALAAGLQFAGRASALIRAAETGDVELVRLFVEAGAVVADVCNCAGAESPLWAAAVRGDREVVEFLLEHGADPNAPAFAGATPLHVVMQRGHHDLVPLLLAAGAEPDRTDEHGRTPADWLARHRPARADRPAPSTIVPTGIRAIDLFAPLRTGSVQHWPPAIGLGQTVLLFAVADALAPAEFWLLGFEHGPYSQAGAEQETRETGVACAVRLARAGEDVGARRAHFGRTLAECLRSPEPKFVALLQAPGHAHDVILALPALARDPNVVSTVVIDPFTGTYPEVEPEPPEGFDAQVAFDVRRARRALWPAIDPASTMTHAYPTDRHAQLASGARERLARVSFEGDAEIPAIARYFAQPFTIAEPFTSRPGERTEYATMLDEVEALLTSG